jgi:hypothetical protein
MRPQTLATAVERIEKGEPRDAMLAGFVDTFDLAKANEDRYASIEQEPKLTGDDQLDTPRRRDRRISCQATPVRACPTLGLRSSAPSGQALVHRHESVGCHAWVPDLQQSCRVRIAQHFHRRTTFAACARPAYAKGIGRAPVRFRTAQARGSSPLRARSVTLPCRVSASPRRSSRCRRRRMIS